MSKLTQPQVKALQYFAALKDGCPSRRMRERGLKFPAARVRLVLHALGLLQWVETTRFDYVLKQDVPNHTEAISPAGLAVLGVDQPF